MLKAIKIRIYPNAEQTNYINRQLGCCRLVYNKCLDYRKTSYENDKTSVSSSETIGHIVSLKDEFPFLKEVHSKVLQQSVRDLNRAYENFFKLHTGYPKFKSKHDNRQSCRFPKDAFIGVRGNRIDLIKCLKDVHFKCSRSDEKYLNKNQYLVSSLTLTKEPTRFFYLSVLIDKPNKIVKQSNNYVGIDLGIKSYIVTSNGETIDNQHFKKSESHRIKHLQRELSKKVKGSNNRNKARIKLAKEYKKINGRKEWFLHSVTNALINENQVICMEDLNVRGMVKNHNLAESISELNLGEFRRMLEYKCKMYGRNLVFIGRFYPSSKTCHNCGYIKKDLTLNDREWICPECGCVIDRDYNASLNILDEGLRILIGSSSPEFTPADCPTMDDRLSDEALKSSDRFVSQSKQEKNVNRNRLSVLP